MINDPEIKKQVTDRDEPVCQDCPGTTCYGNNALQCNLRKDRVNHYGD